MDGDALLKVSDAHDLLYGESRDGFYTKGSVWKVFDRNQESLYYRSRVGTVLKIEKSFYLPSWRGVKGKGCDDSGCRRIVEFFEWSPFPPITYVRPYGDRPNLT